MSSFELNSLKQAAKHLLSADDFTWLLAKRWFADKGKVIADIEVVDLTESELAGVTVLLTIVDVKFQVGNYSTYFIPLMIADESELDRDVGNRPGDGPDLLDAVNEPSFGRWAAELFSSGSDRDVSRDWLAKSAPYAPSYFQNQASLDARPLGAEQSNSSVRIGDDVVVKILRRVYPGENPEDEVLRALSGFSHVRVSTYLGSLYWQSSDGSRYTVAIAEKWVPNRGDGWAWILNQLRRICQQRDVDSFTTEALHALGQRTAELHLALSAAPGEAFGVHVATAEDVSQVQQAFRASLARSSDLVSESAIALPRELKAKLPDIIRAMTSLEQETSGFAAEEGTARIRVHGDYHLGQVLRNTDDDWTIIDFEGEPARSLDERRQRSSALRDVAGMLRSFSYARAVAEQDLSPDAAERELLRAWELMARNAFVSGYWAMLTSNRLDSGVSLIPRSENSFMRALSVWEADKALYEVAYEARNRPGWIGIPLRALLPDLFV